MKVISSSCLTEFIGSVVSESCLNQAEPTKVLVFCHSSVLDGFQFTGKDSEDSETSDKDPNLSIAYINALHHVSLVADAGYHEIQEQLRRIWFEPRDSPRPVFAFYDLLTEVPGCAFENVQSVSVVLYMLARACSSKTPPRGVFLNVPGREQGKEKESDAGVDLRVLNLVSKWVDLPESWGSQSW